MTWHSGGVTPELADSPFLRACRREPVSHTPVWFMRQAGRSLPEYRALREGIADARPPAPRPDLVVEITLQPVRRYGVDAAIFFSDIVVPLKAIGVDLDIKPGVGPVVADPIRDAAAIEACARSSPTTSPTSPRPSQALTRRAGRHAAHRLRGRAVHPRRPT